MLRRLQDVCGNTTQSWQEALRPRCIPSSWRAQASSLHAPLKRVAVSSPRQGASKLPETPWSALAAEPRAGDFTLPAPIDPKGVSLPLGTDEQTLEISLSTCTEPWTNVRRSIALTESLQAPPRAPWSASCRRTTHGRFRSPCTLRPKCVSPPLGTLEPG